MNINHIVGGILLVVLGYYAATAYFYAGKPPPSQLPWVPIDVRRNKVYVSKTRDAGMFTERTRRVAVIGNRDGLFGSSGYLDAFLTAICVCPGASICPPAPDVIWDGGNASSDICDIIDGGNAESEYDVVDFGNAETNVCDV